ncbi:protein phosphatase 1 regulatory subunit 1C isoform X1 [Esox lucius]|uniref:Protein phosphatase 1 regulatory subunit 1C n=1 Tax=Esox lucius TaxID=8010 RepID=A0A3P8ZUK0_ESOLU|nr:protein phosphatase 1 regulatory subunit 1C isoform X1 [Esox lucius]
MESSMETNSPKKIQFAVPVFQSELDPQASEHIRKRRPTPATHVIYLPPDLTAADDRQTTSRHGGTQSAELAPAQRKHSVFTSPTMKDCCQGHREDRENRLHSQTDNLALAEQLSGALPQLTETLAPAEQLSGALPQPTDTPRRKDTPYQHLPPFTPGAKLLKSKSKVSFPEEEEKEAEKEEDAKRNPK